MKRSQIFQISYFWYNLWRKNFARERAHKFSNFEWGGTLNLILWEGRGAFSMPWRQKSPSPKNNEQSLIIISGGEYCSEIQCIQQSRYVHRHIIPDFQSQMIFLVFTVLSLGVHTSLLSTARPMIGWPLVTAAANAKDDVFLAIL